VFGRGYASFGLLLQALPAVTKRNLTLKKQAEPAEIFAA